MIPPEYVQARSVLLDALGGLGPHRDAVVLVGAQAVYLHTGDADFATAPTTTDADLALVPDRLADEPVLAEAMRAAGFVPGTQPGIWLGRGQIAVDLMAPEGLCAGGRRSAHLPPPHNNRTTARRTYGLEAAVVDNAVRVIGALAGDDGRSFKIKVAGPAALLVSKVIKIAERRADPRRLKPKDGLDVLRLLRAVDTAQLAWTLTELASDNVAGSVVEQAVQALRELAAGPEDVLPTLAADAEAGFGDLDVITMSMVVLVDDLLGELDP
ncbi:hypothetical protein [Actinocrispum wychmicini]|uniref:hypothetical protein n=1 Tax=Actinocrispum wychmicini TaxID=1213861 RepID=UPI001A9E9C7A|nr:hypothetical protein [Actinocrispum wychmicini]